MNKLQIQQKNECKETCIHFNACNRVAYILQCKTGVKYDNYYCSKICKHYQTINEFIEENSDWIKKHIYPEHIYDAEDFRKACEEMGWSFEGY